MRRPVPLVLAGLLALTTVAVVAVPVASLVRDEAARPPAVTTAGAPAAPVGSRALRVLHGWDRRRAGVWAHGEPRALGGLYAAASEAGTADQAMLARYRERGLRVRAMRRQTLVVRVLSDQPRRLTLRVTDRLTSAVAVGHGVEQALPAGRLTTSTLTFRRTERGWVLRG
jgi:hypothetical protein